MPEEIITGGITIPEFSITVPAVTGDLVSGSQTITAIDTTLVRVGQSVSGTGIPSGTTVSSVVVGGIGPTGGTGSVQLSQPASSTEYVSTLHFSLPDGNYYISNSTFINVPGLYYTDSIVPGFLIYNNALDASSLVPLAGIFDRFVITEVTERASSILISFFCEYDETGPYSSTGHVPQSATQNAISAPTPNKKFSKLVSPDIGYDFQAGSVTSQYNVDVQDVDDIYPTIIGPTGQIVTPGATGIQFTGAGVVSVTEPQPGVAVVTIEGGGGGVTGATGYIPVFNSANSVIESQIPLYEDSANKRLGIGTTGPLLGVHYFNNGTTGAGVSGGIYYEVNSNTDSAQFFITARATGPSPVFDQVGAVYGVDPTTDSTNTGRSTFSLTVNNNPTGVAGLTGFGLHIKPRQSNSPTNKNQGFTFGERNQSSISRYREIAYSSDSNWGSTNTVSQNTILSLWGNVTGAGIMELRTDRGGTAESYNKLFVRTNSVLTADAKLQLYSSNSDNSYFEVKCKIRNVSSTLTLTSSPTIIVNDNSIAGFNPSTDIQVAIDSVSNALSIKITSPGTSYAFGKIEFVDLGIPI